MTESIVRMSDTGRGAVLMCLYGLLLIQFGCNLAGTGRRERDRKIPGIVLLLITGSGLLVFRDMNEKLLSGAKMLCQVQVWMIVLIVPMLAAGTGWLIWRTIRYYRNTLTRSAIKESVECLPTGLCFSMENGFILLSNRKMEQLCMELTGADLQDAERFWQRITEELQRIQAEPMRYKDTPCFRLKNGEIWTFQRERLEMNDRPIWQMTAVNISELYHLSEQLEKENVQLTQMNQRLCQHGQNMDAYVRSREILDTKIRIHKEMGQALLASRAWLMQKNEILEEADVLKRWEYVILLLKKETESMEEPDKWEQFVTSARQAGVQIQVKGKLPEAGKQLELLMLSATEALTNAVRHGGADQLFIELKTEDAVVADITNNGKRPESPIREGGGLSALRIRLEEAGGELYVHADPEFTLTVTLPREREKI